MHLPKLLNVNGANYLILSEHYNNKVLSLHCKMVENQGVFHNKIVYPKDIELVIIHAYGVLCEVILIDDITRMAKTVDKFIYTKNGKRFDYKYGMINSSASSDPENVFVTDKKNIDR